MRLYLLSGTLLVGAIFSNGLRADPSPYAVKDPNAPVPARLQELRGLVREASLSLQIVEDVLGDQTFNLGLICFRVGKLHSALSDLALARLPKGPFKSIDGILDEYFTEEGAVAFKKAISLADDMKILEEFCENRKVGQAAVEKLRNGLENLAPRLKVLAANP